jgi:hypothetical protein
MGTRLYPVTYDTAVLETLANVPPGTLQRLRDLRAKLAHDEFALYNAIYEDRDLHRMDGFDTFGWGKLRSPVYALLEKHPEMWDGETSAGECEDTGFCRAILAAQGIEVPEGIDFGHLVWN